MSGLARQAAVLSLARIMNYGLMLVGPIVLVRLLTVEDFGRYREFHLYAGLLAEIAALTINDSLLYFLPSHPQQPWRVVRQTVFLVAGVSSGVTALFLLGDVVAHGHLIGEFAVPVALYVLFYVNLDFWQAYWVAQGQGLRVLVYTSGRSAARLLVAVGLAATTGDVLTMVWGLVALEFVRVLVSTAGWARRDGAATEPPLSGMLKEQLDYCVPMGIAVFVTQGSRYVGGLLVAKVLGPAALALYSVGLYVEPIVTVVRNSISNIVLPEMIRRGIGAGGGLGLWQRTTVVTCIVLFPIVVVLARFAVFLVDTVFGADYRTASVLLQIYLISVVRECFDFSPALRAKGLTGVILRGSAIGIVVNIAALALLMPLAGGIGAMSAWAVASWCTGFYLAWCMTRAYVIKARDLLPWGTVARVAACAMLASAVLIPGAWTESFGLAGIMLASFLYAIVFLALLRASGVQEERAVTGFVMATLRPALSGWLR